LLLTLGGLGYFLYRQNQENRRYSTLALRDDLTGLPNRRSILRFAHAQLKLGHENKQALCLALIDIDHFKSINDNYGHAIGDAVLTAFANACKQTLRADDRIGRYGGEEFLLILPNFFLPDIPVLFEQLRSAVQQIKVAGLPHTHVLAFSMGVVETDSQTGVDALIKRADDALYKAKDDGRNRFEIG
jgi:diguanylate cyclase (GGDEF)-like protein